MEAEVTLPDFPKGDVKTLGDFVASWMYETLVQPDGENQGGEFLLTPEQLNFVRWFYAVDERGRFKYRRAVLRRSKGWGKSPFLGAICLAELCGPVRFAGWNDSDDEVLYRVGPWTAAVDPGDPIPTDHPMPWVNLAGVSETQTQNTMSVVLSMLEGAPASEMYNLDVGLTRVYKPGGGKLVPITASSSTQEGARPSFAVLDETHHWTASNGGWKLAEVIRRNLAKSRDGMARSIETTNAHAPGEESVAEKSYLAYLAQKEGTSASDGLLYDARSAPVSIDLSDPDMVLEGLRLAYGDASWVDLERIREEVYDPSTSPEESRRFYLNQIVAAANAWVRPASWEQNFVPDLEPLRFAKPGNWRQGEVVTLGFDGSLTDDSTALVAVRASDSAPFLLGIWERPQGSAGHGWEVDKGQVRDLVDYVMSTLNVVAFFADYAYWETDVDNWRDKYAGRLKVKATTKHAIAWDMRGKHKETTQAVEALNRAIVDGELPHGPHKTLNGQDGHAILTRHVLNARYRPNRWGAGFGKEHRESPNKVDALAAMMLARMARTRALADGALGRSRSNTLYGF
jgi:hypothetical protein